jgi:hypothetical protein
VIVSICSLRGASCHHRPRLEWGCFARASRLTACRKIKFDSLSLPEHTSQIAIYKLTSNPQWISPSRHSIAECALELNSKWVRDSYPLLLTLRYLGIYQIVKVTCDFVLSLVLDHPEILITTCHYIQCLANMFTRFL